MAPIMYIRTKYNHTVLVEAFGDHFGPFNSNFKALSKILGPILSLFLTFLLPKRAQMAQNRVQ